MPFLPLQIDAIKAASLERQAQLDRETAELKQQQDELTAKLKEFQQRVSSCEETGTQFGCLEAQFCACGLPSATLHCSRSTAAAESHKTAEIVLKSFTFSVPPPQARV